MKLVFQIRLTEVEAKNVKANPQMLEHLVDHIVLPLEMLRQRVDKPVTGEVVVEGTGEVIKEVP
jgi:hypothetical protein